MSERTPDAVKPIASGYLFKLARNKRYFSTWHRRYYVLYSDGTLYSFKNLRSSTINRTITIGRMCITIRLGEEVGDDDCSSWPSNIPKSLCFSIVNSDRSYHFVCESRREFERWEASLRDVLHNLQSDGAGGKPDHGAAGGGAGAVEEGGAAAKAANVEKESIEEDAETEGYDKTGRVHPYLVSPSTEIVSGASPDDNAISAHAHGPEKTGHLKLLSTEIRFAESKGVEKETPQNNEAVADQDNRAERCIDEPIQNEVSKSTPQELDITTRRRSTSLVLNNASGYDHVGPASPTGQDSNSEEDVQPSNAYTEINGVDDKDTEGKYTDKKDPHVHDVSFTASTALLHHVDEIVHEAFNEMVAEETTALPIANGRTASSPEPLTQSAAPALTGIQQRVRQFIEGPSSNVTEKSNTSTAPEVSPPSLTISGLSVAPVYPFKSSYNSQNEELKEVCVCVVYMCMFGV